jgi:hypothetical protein
MDRRLRYWQIVWETAYGPDEPTWANPEIGEAWVEEGGAHHSQTVWAVREPDRLDA